MKRFTLVPDTISKDTIACLRALLSHAEQGQLIGIAFAAMYKRKKFIVNSAGEAHQSPVFSLGMVDLLKDELKKNTNRPK